MKNFSRQCWLGLVLSLFMFSANAQNFRIGYVNTDRIFKEANAAKAAQAKLEREFAKRQKDLVDQGNTIKAASDQLEREGPTLPNSQLITRQQQLQDQDRDFQRKRREFQEDLNSRKNEELQQLLDRANQVVKQIAVTEKYDVILQQAVYINPKLDITDEVIKALNAAPAPAK